MDEKTSDLKVTNNESESRFEARIGEDVAVAEYDIDGDTITFTHTEVPEKFEGQGVASTLIRSALDDARKRGLKVVPQCQYVASWIERHADYSDLIASGKGS